MIYDDTVYFEQSMLFKIYEPKVGGIFITLQYDTSQIDRKLRLGRNSRIIFFIFYQ